MVEMLRSAGSCLQGAGRRMGVLRCSDFGQDACATPAGSARLGSATGGEVWRSAMFKPQLRSWGGHSRRVLQQRAVQQHAGALCATRPVLALALAPRCSLSLARPCAGSPRSHASCATAVSDAAQHPEPGRMGWCETRRSAAALKENVHGVAYLCFPSHRSARGGPARPRRRRGCAAVCDATSVGGRGRVETSRTGRSRSRRVRAAVAVSAGRAAPAAAGSREDS